MALPWDQPIGIDLPIIPQQSDKPWLNGRKKNVSQKNSGGIQEVLIDRNFGPIQDEGQEDIVTCAPTHLNGELPIIAPGPSGSNPGGPPGGSSKYGSGGLGTSAPWDIAVAPDKEASAGNQVRNDRGRGPSNNEVYGNGNIYVGCNINRINSGASAGHHVTYNRGTITNCANGMIFVNCNVYQYKE